MADELLANRSAHLIKGALVSSRPTFGLINTFENPPEGHVPWPKFYDAVLEQIAWIDGELQIDTIELSEHHFFDDGYLSAPMSMSAVVAAQTSRVNVGTNLIQLPLNNAVKLAEEALLVDALSGGRFRLGVGMGYFNQEFQGLGTNVAHRVSRMEEGIAILRKAFAGETFSFHGKRYDFQDIHITPDPVRPGGPPIWVGAAVPKAIERAALLGDGYLAWDLTTYDAYFAACDALGRPKSEQRINATYWAIIAEDPERAFAEAGDYWMYLINGYIARGVYTDRDIPLTTPFTDPREALKTGEILLTDAAGAIELFNSEVDKGVIDFSLLTLMPGEPVDQVSERLQYFNDHVLPFVKESTHPAVS